MSSRIQIAVLGTLVAAAGLLGQEMPLQHSSVEVKLPSDSPVQMVSMSTGESRRTMRGNAIVLDLHMELKLRNAGNQKIRGLTLRVVAQELTPGGRGSVAKPSLAIAPGEAFPVHIDLQLMRPAQVQGGPLVEVTLDGVLFDGFGFYGPNRLDSKRTLTAWEMEAERDRKYFKSVLQASGKEALRQEIFQSLNRQAERPRLNVAVASAGRAVASTARAERTEKFAFLEIPDSPVKPIEGWAQIAGNEARAPRIAVENRSNRPVRYVEIGWIVTDRAGQEYMAASVPASDPELYLPPGKTGRVLQENTLRFTKRGQAVSIAKMAGFVSQVEFADGKVWVPNRKNLSSVKLLNIVAPSPEEQRLTELYRKNGLDALIQELNKF